MSQEECWRHCCDVAGLCDWRDYQQPGCRKQLQVDRAAWAGLKRLTPAQAAPSHQSGQSGDELFGLGLDTDDFFENAFYYIQLKMCPGHMEDTGLAACYLHSPLLPSCTRCELTTKTNKHKNNTTFKRICVLVKNALLVR